MSVEIELFGPATDGSVLPEGHNYLQQRSSEKFPESKLIANKLMEKSPIFANVSFTHYELPRKWTDLLFLM